MIKIFGGFYVHVTFFIIFIISFFTGTFYETSIAFLMALCHELSHLLCALYLKERCHAIAVMPYGLRLFITETKSLLHEFLIAAMGPFFNLIMIFFFKKGPLFDVNLAMLLINLFPVMPLDGGRMCYALLSLWKGPFKSFGIIKKISLFGGIFLTLTGIYQAVFTGFNLSILTAGAFLLFGAITEKNRVKIYKDCLLRTNEKVRKEPQKAFFLVSGENVKARKVLEQFPAEKYTFIGVLGENGTLSGIVTEEEFLEDINHRGALIKIGDILEKRC